MNWSKLVTFPEISRCPERAIPVIVLLHVVTDPVTAYWMMDSRGPGFEGNPLVIQVYQLGPKAFIAFVILAAGALGGMFWIWRENLWSNDWMPVFVELVIIAGITLTLSNAISMLGYF